MKAKHSRTTPKRSPSDLTRTQWKRLQRLLPPARPGGRPREVNLREILNGIFSITRGGGSWRMMPKDLPPWSTCYDYFRKWRNDGTWQRINGALRTQIRHRDQRESGFEIQ
jgi:putative transposase